MGFRAVDHGLSTNMEKRICSIVNVGDPEKATRNSSDDDYVQKILTSTAISGAASAGSEESNLEWMAGLKHSTADVHLDASEDPPRSLEPSNAEATQGKYDKRSPHLEFDGEDFDEHSHDEEFKTPHTPTEATRRTYQCLSETVQQNFSRKDGAGDGEPSLGAGVDTTRRATGGNGAGRRAVSASGRPCLVRKR